LAFVSLETTSPSVDEIRKHHLLEILGKNVLNLYQMATKVCLKVLYVQLNHARMLMESTVYPSQCFGVWWVLHLLYGQKLGFYQRDYRSMAIRDCVIPRLCKFIKEYSTQTEFLVKMSVECLYLLSEDTSLKIQLVHQGVLDVFQQLKEIFFQGSELGVLVISNLLESPSHFLIQNPTTLKGISTNYICQNTDVDQYCTLLEMCDMYQFHEMKLYFMSSLFLSGAKAEDVGRVSKDITECLMLMREAKEISDLVTSCRLSTKFEVSLQERSFAVLRESNPGDEQHLRVIKLMKMLGVDKNCDISLNHDLIMMPACEAKSC